MNADPVDHLPADASLPDTLPVLTHIASDPLLDDLPMLTEVVTPAPPAPSAPSLSETEMQELLRQLESRLEVVFTQKLGMHLEKLQRLAIRQAVNEFRAALPELLREILNTPPAPRP